MTPSAELVFVLTSGLMLSLLIVLGAWAKRGAGVTAADPLPDASFDFQESWLSTFTGLIAILGTISISGFVFVGSGSGAGSSFPLLSLFFAILVAGGPLAYKAMASADGTGTVGGFLLAAAATLWAAFGVIFALAMFLVSIGQATEGGDILSGAPGQAGLATLLMMAVIVILIPLIAAYAFSKMSKMLRSRKELSTRTFFL